MTTDDIIRTDDGKECIIMVCLDHPCWEIDVARGVDPQDVKPMEGQGYIRLEELRRLREELKATHWLALKYLEEIRRLKGEEVHADKA